MADPTSNPKEGPGLTVIIPTWNRAEQVTQLLTRLRREQTDQRFDLVVVDDGSDDDTVARIRSAEIDRLVLVVAPHEGVSAARNRGAAAATTEWIAFLDSDDEPDPDWTATLRSLIAGETGGDPDQLVDIVSVGQRRQDEDGTIDLRSPKGGGAAFADLPVLWLAGNFAITKILFDAVGGYSPAFDFSESTDFALRIAAHHDVHPVHIRHDPAPRLTRFVRPGRYDPEQRLRTAQLILDLHDDRLELQPHLRATYEAMAGVAAGKLGNRTRAVGHLVRAIRSEPLQPRHHARLIRAAIG